MLNPLLIGSIGLGLLTQARLTTIEGEQARARGLGERNDHDVIGGAPPHAVIGILPTDVYDKMRAVKTSADALNADVLRNVADGPFKNAWRAWYASYNDFFERNYQKLATVLHTSEVDQRTEEFRTQLGDRDLTHGWYGDYRQQRTASGQLVPPPTGQPPIPAPAGGGESGSGSGGVPWWVWVVGTVAVGGIGYLGYRQYKEMQAKKRVLEREVLPKVLGASFGPELGGSLSRAATARDESGYLLRSSDFSKSDALYSPGPERDFYR